MKDINLPLKIAHFVKEKKNYPKENIMTSVSLEDAERIFQRKKEM